MFWVSFCLCLLVPVIFFFYRHRTTSIPKLYVSNVFYFTIIWWVCYPFRALAGELGLIINQSGRGFDQIATTNGLVVALLMWVVIAIGYCRRTVSMPTWGEVRWSNTRFLVPTLLASAAGLTAALFFKLSMLTEVSSFTGIPGSGPLLLIASLPLTILIAVSLPLTRAYVRGEVSPFAIVALTVALVACILIGVLLGSRRDIVLGIVALVLAFALVRERFWWLAPMSFVGSVFLVLPASLLKNIVTVDYNSFSETIRLSKESLLDHLRDFSNSPIKDSLRDIFSTYEGINHLGQFLLSASWKQILFGIDQGISWVFQAGLGLVPRLFWPSKPTIYGSGAQQAFLYPETIQEGEGLLTVAFPVGIGVDFMYGFGLIGLVVLSFCLGRVFRFFDTALHEQSRNDFVQAASLFSLVMMFNLLRSGTAMIQSLLIFFAAYILIFGIRRFFVSSRD